MFFDGLPPTAAVKAPGREIAAEMKSAAFLAILSPSDALKESLTRIRLVSGLRKLRLHLQERCESLIDKLDMLRVGHNLHQLMKVVDARPKGFHWIH
jgi:hypothetical protein